MIKIKQFFEATDDLLRKLREIFEYYNIDWYSDSIAYNVDYIRYPIEEDIYFSINNPLNRPNDDTQISTKTRDIDQIIIKFQNDLRRLLNFVVNQTLPIPNWKMFEPIYNMIPKV